MTSTGFYNLDIVIFYNIAMILDDASIFEIVEIV